ncbi:MAG: TIGR02453 family protein [Acidimicrobiales bacterium]
MSGFAGFPSDAWTFLSELAADNTKTFFDGNRHRYDGTLAAPAKALVEAMGVVLPARLDLAVHAEPKVGRSLFRINRDTRFAADKTPYKTYLDFLFWVGEGPPRARPAFIMRLTAREMLVGGGRLGLAGGALEAYRAQLDAPARSAGLRAAVDALLASGAELSEPNRARPPRPTAVEHPNADLLRRDGFHLTRTTAHPAAIARADLPEWCAAALEPFTPIVRWFSAVDG